MAEQSKLTDEAIAAVIATIPQRPFHTAHFIERLETLYPELWGNLVTTYGSGGRGAGVHYTAFSAVSQALSRASERGLLDKLEDYGKAPPELNWGSPVIRYWTDTGGFSQIEFPDEVEADQAHAFFEGSVLSIIVNRYERSAAARAACISHFGSSCSGCDMDFASKYGARGKDFIHVHHLVPLHRVRQDYEVDPIKDLIPVCPNCHAMIHRADPMLTIEGLRKVLKEASEAGLLQ